MSFAVRRLALTITFAQALSAGQVPTNPKAASARNQPVARAGRGVVRTSPSCDEVEGGRHFGDRTAFSQSPLAGCWPR
jgi:hypothetical protein